MIISHEHKFIFIHCRKVAGSSMKVALAPHLGDSDLIIGSLNEIKASGTTLPLAMRQSLSRPSSLVMTAAACILGKSWGEAQNIAVKRRFVKALGSNPPHPPASYAAQYLGPIWSEYVKFCFVRNPYERVVSDYFWRKRLTAGKFDFARYLEALKDRNGKKGIIHPYGVSNWEMMTIDGNIVVDIIGQYENLSNDFQRITKQLGLPNIKLNNTEKKGNRKEAYGEVYGPKEKALVYELFKREIDYFGYEFPYYCL